MLQGVKHIDAMYTMFRMGVYTRPNDNNQRDVVITNSDTTSSRCCKISYSNLKTGVNDPTISKRMQYAKYVRNF